MDESVKSRWEFAYRHAWRSLAGLIRTFFSHPFFALTLVSARAHYFISRTLRRPIRTPDQYEIRTINELVSYWSLFVERECSHPTWVRALRQNPKSLVLDVGANAGLFSHLVWHLRKNTEIHAFDPLPAMAKRITDQAAQTGAAITVHNCAVSDQPGTATFYAAAENDPTASLKPVTEKQISLPVKVVTLDSVAPAGEILLVKIDVEGVECEVLRGAINTLKRTRFLIIEALSSRALAEIKASLGPDWQCTPVGDTDYFFARNGDLKS